MIFDLIVIVILVGAVLGGLKISALIKAALVIFILTLVLQVVPVSIKDFLVNGSKLYIIISPWAMKAYAALKPLIAKIDLVTFKTWLLHLAQNAKPLSPLVP